MSTILRPGMTLSKDPDALLFYQFDWGGEWLPSGVDISNYAITISGKDAALTFDNDGLLTGNRQVQVRLKAGTVGVTYRVTCRITTDETPSQTDERSVWIRVEER